jgi:osmotically-inducible protein OsmY
MPSKRNLSTFASIFALALAISPGVRAQTVSDWGKATMDTGKDALHAADRAFHELVDDPILIEKTKSALSNDPATRNQPIVVSASKGIIILQGKVPTATAERAVQLASRVEGAAGVENDMLYDGSASVRNVDGEAPR